MKILTEQQIQQIYPMEQAIQDVQDALIAHYNGNVENPHRTVVEFPKEQASILYMPSVWEKIGIAAVKVVSIFPNNPRLGKKTTQGLILLTNTETGEHIACMDASYLTRLRTGALSALATKFLAKPTASTLAIIGCGKMAEEQVRGVLAVRNIEEILLYNRTKEKAEAFVKKVKDQNPSYSGKITVAKTADEAVQRADIIVCATRSDKPVFSGHSLRAGTHINGVGSYLPHMQEVDERTVLRSAKIVVDTVDGAKDEAGDLIIPANKGIWSFDQLHGQLDELVAGKIPGRETAMEITFFKSVGTAYFDLAVAAAVYKKAVELEMGIELDLFS